MAVLTRGLMMKRSRAAVGVLKAPLGWVLLGLPKRPPPAAAAAVVAQVGSANVTPPNVVVAYAAHTPACMPMLVLPILSMLPIPSVYCPTLQLPPSASVLSQHCTATCSRAMYEHALGLSSVGCACSNA